MKLNEFPDEIIDIIFKYIFIECNHCNENNHRDNIQRNVVINKYRSIFDDDYDFPRESMYFNIICNKCLKKYFIDDKKFIYSIINQTFTKNENTCFCKYHKK